METWIKVKNHLKAKSSLWCKKFSEAWIACSTMMVQGDFTVFTKAHALTAAEVGATAGIGVVLTSYIANLDNRFLLHWVTGVVVMLADIAVHPTHFGDVWSEAVCTGIGAMILSVILGKIYR